MIEAELQAYAWKGGIFGDKSERGRIGLAVLAELSDYNVQERHKPCGISMKLVRAVSHKAWHTAYMPHYIGPTSMVAVSGTVAITKPSFPSESTPLFTVAGMTSSKESSCSDAPFSDANRGSAWTTQTITMTALSL